MKKAYDTGRKRNVFVEKNMDFARSLKYEKIYDRQSKVNGKVEKKIDTFRSVLLKKKVHVSDVQ